MKCRSQLATVKANEPGGSTGFFLKLYGTRYMRIVYSFSSSGQRLSIVSLVQSYKGKGYNIIVRSTQPVLRRALVFMPLIHQRSQRRVAVVAVYNDQKS